MEAFKSSLIVFCFSLIPYCVVAWLVADHNDESNSNFWTVFLILLAARFFFSVIEWLGSIVTWRLYGRSRMIRNLSELFRSNSFPPMGDDDSEFFDYAQRIQQENQIHESAPLIARDVWSIISALKLHSPLAGWRMESAANYALKEYFSEK